MCLRLPKLSLKDPLILLYSWKLLLFKNGSLASFVDLAQHNLLVAPEQFDFILQGSLLSLKADIVCELCVADSGPQVITLLLVGCESGGVVSQLSLEIGDFLFHFDIPA